MEDGAGESWAEEMGGEDMSRPRIGRRRSLKIFDGPAAGLSARLSAIFEFDSWTIGVIPLETRGI